jgi:hypothetical protein
MEEVEKRKMTSSLTSHGAAVGPFHMNAPSGPKSPWRAVNAMIQRYKPRQALLFAGRDCRVAQRNEPGKQFVWRIPHRSSQDLLVA